MTLKIDTQTLAHKLGVSDVPVGSETVISNRRVEEVIETLREQGLKFLGYYKSGPFVHEPNVVYLNVQGQILGAKAWNPQADTGCLPPKPEGYKDGHRWVPYQPKM